MYRMKEEKQLLQFKQYFVLMLQLFLFYFKLLLILIFKLYKVKQLCIMRWSLKLIVVLDFYYFLEGYVIWKMMKE